MVSMLKASLFAATAAVVAPAVAAPVARAGEWETVIGQRTTYVCLSKDKVFDMNGLVRVMPGGGKCAVRDLQTAGAVTSFVMACDVAGGHLTTHNTMTVTGDQAYTMHVTSHMEGGPQPMPDVDLTQVSHRTGACQPRDRASPD